MRNSIMPQQFTPKTIRLEDADKQDNDTSEPATDTKEKHADQEGEKSDAEKRAKLMHIIWGDNFLSDSLH